MESGKDIKSVIDMVGQKQKYGDVFDHFYYNIWKETGSLIYNMKPLCLRL
jgi:hypothetical protein